MTKINEKTEAGGAGVDLHAGRRAFLKTSGLMAAGAAAIGLGAGTSAVQAQQIDDTAILNFALNLEYLEAEFYLRAAFGRGLSGDDTDGTGKKGSVSVPPGAPISSYPSKLSARILAYAKEIANDEENHVKFLRSQLKSARVARPAINLNTSFTFAARAAGLISGSQTFNAFANDTSFLLAAFIFEDVGVTAYKGAARFISDPRKVEDAAGILAVEAYHAGAIRTLLAAEGQFAAANAISAARDSLDGRTQIDQGIGSAKSLNIVPTDGTGKAFSRTPQQVLNIVYLDTMPDEDMNKTPRSEAFFPAKLNGAIN